MIYFDDDELEDTKVKFLLDVYAEYEDTDFEDGPCFDYCPCRRCWNGWTGLPRWKRLLYRLEHIVRSRSLK